MTQLWERFIIFRVKKKEIQLYKSVCRYHKFVQRTSKLFENGKRCVNHRQLLQKYALVVVDKYVGVETEKSLSKIKFKIQNSELR